MTETAIIDTEESNADFLKELAALARMITFAKQNAQSLQIEFPVYCLDLALGAVVEELQSRGITAPHVEASLSENFAGSIH